MNFDFSCTINIDISEPKLDKIIYCFSSIFGKILRELSQQVLVSFADEYMSWHVKPFSCIVCGNDKYFNWKTHRGKATSLLTIFGQLILSQLQIKCKDCGHKFYLTRKLLGVDRRKRIPLSTIRHLGLIRSVNELPSG
jgi:ribosomal protein L37E